MMDIKLIYSFILLGTSSALAPGRNPLRHLAAEKGPVTSPAQLLPPAAAEVATELPGVSAEDTKTAQQHVQEAVSNMEDQISVVAEELEQLPSSVGVNVDEVVEVVKDVASQIEAVTASDLAGSFPTEDATNATALMRTPLDPACFNLKSDKFQRPKCELEMKVVMVAIQNAIAAIKTAIIAALTALAKKRVEIKVDAFKGFVDDVTSFILLVKAKIELVKGLLTKLTKAGIETADTSVMLKEVKAMGEVMDETYDTMTEVQDVDDPTALAEPLAYLLEYLAALIEKMPNAAGADLEEVAMTEMASFGILFGDFKTFLLQLKNVIRACVLKHGGSTTSHESKASKASYKSEKESWKEECLEALQGYKLSAALLGLDDNSMMMADAMGLDLTAMESVAPQDQDTTEATTISVSKFQAYDSSGMHKSFPAAISSILVASAFVLLF